MTLRNLFRALLRRPKPVQPPKPVPECICLPNEHHLFGSPDPCCGATEHKQITTLVDWRRNDAGDWVDVRVR